MESVLVRLVLFCLSGFWWGPRASALPVSTIQVRVGEDATLHCPLLDTPHSTTLALNTGAPADPPPAYTLSWYRKAAGQSPQLLLTVRSMDRAPNVRYGSGVRPDRVSAVPDGSLRLRGSKCSDAAIYFCSISLGHKQQKKKLREK